MSPRPMADTSGPFGPSVRVVMALILSLVLWSRALPIGDGFPDIVSSRVPPEPAQRAHSAAHHAGAGAGGGAARQHAGRRCARGGGVRAGLVDRLRRRLPRARA